MYWTDETWRGWAARARHWIITVADEPAGLTSMIAEADGSVELAAFGLAPEFESVPVLSDPGVFRAHHDALK